MSGAVRTIVSLWRGTATLALFALFGIGALIISPLMLALRSRRRCHAAVRASWRLLVWAFTSLRLVRIETEGLRDLHGCIIAANHPSLIDAVIMVALIPRTLYIAKHALLQNPFMSTIVRHTSLPDDARLPEAAAPLLANGWNVLIFPEGTRTPTGGPMHQFKRGAAQLALRTSAPIVCAAIDFSRPILGKRQMPWDMGDATIACSVRFGEMLEPDPLCPHAAATALRSRAATLTERLQSEVGRLLQR